MPTVQQWGRRESIIWAATRLSLHAGRLLLRLRRLGFFIYGRLINGLPQLESYNLDTTRAARWRVSTIQHVGDAACRGILHAGPRDRQLIWRRDLCGARLGAGVRTGRAQRPGPHNCGTAELGERLRMPGFQTQQAAKRPNVWAHLIRRNISFIAALPIEKQCFDHFLAVGITNSR